MHRYKTFHLPNLFPPTHRAHFSRDPAAAEKILTNGESKSVAAAPASEIAAWTMVTNLLLNLDETVTRN